MPVAFDTLSLVFLTRGHAARSAPAAEAGRLQAEHLAHLAAMFERGALAVAGPLGRGDDDDHVRGLCVYRVGVAEATSLASDDPAVRVGQFAVDARTWRFPAGYVSFPMQGRPWWKQ